MRTLSAAAADGMRTVAVPMVPAEGRHRVQRAGTALAHDARLHLQVTGSSQSHSIAPLRYLYEVPFQLRHRHGFSRHAVVPMMTRRQMVRALRRLGAEPRDAVPAGFAARLMLQLRSDLDDANRHAGTEGAGTGASPAEPRVEGAASAPAPRSV